MPRPTPRYPLRWPDLPQIPSSRLRHEVIQALEVNLPLWVVVHLLAPFPSPGLGPVALFLANICAWVFAPILGVCLVGCCVFALTDRALREVIPVCVLGLLLAWMVRDILTALA